MMARPSYPKTKKAVQDIVPDATLWDQIKRQINPISSGPPASPFSDFENLMNSTGDAARASVQNAKKTPKKAGQLPSSSAIPSTSPAPSLRQSVNDIDRRTQQKLLRGQANIDARLDLHGETVQTAYVKLLSFLSNAQNSRSRLVLVITGKGASPYARHTLHSSDYFDTPERAGILRRKVMDWLSRGEFSAFISGFQPAHPKHGGGGAVYVRIRRRKV